MSDKRMWPTPVVSDYKGGVSLETWGGYDMKTKAKRSSVLRHAVVFPTPGTKGLSNGSGNCEKANQLYEDGVITDEERKSFRAGNGGQLNPGWVEWLMGWPKGWVSLEPMEKSDYEPKTQEADNSVDADTVNDATAFLETFFKLYPTATDKELAYYVEGNALEPINGDYLYSELVNPVFMADGDNVKVSVAVKFIDNQTKATQISQYKLTLHKDSNWKIVG